MSRYYEMWVSITGFNADKTDVVQAAADAEWGFDDWRTEGSTLNGSGRSNLCGGEGEEEFAQRLASAIFKANGGPCHIDVEATYLEDLPHESYIFDEEDYERLTMEEV